MQDVPHAEPLSQPSARFLGVLQDLAQRVHADLQLLVEGQPVQYEGFTFRLTHEGSQDPAGMTVMIEMGLVGEGSDGAAIYKRLLEQNALMQAALSGYFCVLPGTDVVAYGFRVDLERVPNAADAILASIGLLGDDMQRLVRIIETEADPVMRQAPAHFDSAAPLRN